MTQGRQRIPLLETELPVDPLDQFQRWFEDANAAGLALAEAMALATTTPDGHPTVRMVLLKGLEAGGFTFYTNYESRKADELARNPRAALMFHWAALERQIRIEGRVERVSAADSDAYFATRHVGSRHSAWASPQSKVVPNRDWLEARAREYAGKYGEDVPRPPHWGGYRVLPDLIEFWQGRADRLHDRLCYRRGADRRWEITRLAP